MRLHRFIPLLAALPLTAAIAASPAPHATHAAAAPEPVVTQVMTQPLPDYPGKEALVLTVEYPPGGADPVHRHDAHGFVYVIEGHIVMGVAGGPEITLGPGEVFHEGPKDVHTVGRNASKTQPAKFVAFLLKDVGKPAVLPPH
ncbi:MAG TPA: cupin domain-containing protein [Stenotrophomonas sp.]|jgi:quercetin dioxygenase-like cupin family protein